MKTRWLTVIIAGIVLLLAFSLAGCTSTPSQAPAPATTPQSMPQLADTAEDLELQVNNGMTLDQVYSSMTPELRNQSIIYPAQNIIRQADGKWQFTAKAGGSLGDIDAPFQVLVFTPSPIRDPYYMIFFDNEKVFHHAWFEYDAATGIQKLLWTTETTD